MKKAIIKGVSIAVIFFLALVLLSAVMNQGNTDMTAEMSDPTYPIVSMFVGDYQVNAMHGYAESMNSAYIRDTLQPIENDRKIGVQVDTYGRKISEIAFEVRSLEGERLVESTEVASYELEDDRITFDITLKDLIENNEEYLLVFLITPEGGTPIRYYSRIVMSDSLHMQEKLDYIVDFHERTFDKEAAKELTKYLESNSEGDNTTFHKVTIHSSFDQVTWGDLNVSQITEPQIEIKELTEQTGSFRMGYIASVTDDKDKSYYRVSEYYRIRYTADRMYLLDYERDMTQIFDEQADSYVNDKIMLGIAGDTVTLQESDGGNVFTFTVADKLYSYNVTDNRLARLFSFYDNTEQLLDARSAYDKHDVKVLSVDETGNVSFLVYGYMNRGRHEGTVGVAVYSYNSMANTVEELIYIPYDKSYELLKEDIDQLSYLNKSGIYYFMLNASVYAVNLESQSCQMIVSGLQENGYHVSDSNKMLVWQDDGDLYDSRSLTLMNLNTQTRTTISAGSGEYISVLGFMDEDLVYGLARQRDVVENNMGNTTFPMYCLKIQSDMGDLLKTYQKQGVYVVDCTIEENQMNLTRVSWDEESESYVQATDDQIMNTGEVKAGSNVLSYVVTEHYETICEIDVKGEIDSKGLKMQTPKEVVFEGKRLIDIPEPEEMKAYYYVYGKDGIEGVYEQPGEAVAQAYSLSGVVVDDDGDYVWRRVTRSTRNQIMAITEEEVTETKSSLAVCLETILKYEGISRNVERQLTRGDTIMDILESDLQKCTVLDLTGCSLDAVLYYVNQDIPVLATLEDGNAVLVVGFNELNIVLMDPVTGTLYYKGMNDSAEWFTENGNSFITYMRKE